MGEHESPAAVRPLRQGIGRRLLGAILLFSSVVTLVLTAVQLTFDYRRDKDAIERRLVELESSYGASLADSLWHIDADQIKLQLDGILRLPDFTALQVREVGAAARPLVVSVGRPQADPPIIRVIPLVHDDHGARHIIGELRVEATLDQVYARLAETSLVILATQGVKTFIVSLFILLMVHRLVTRHLVAIAAHLDAYDVHRPVPPLAVERAAPASPDELDRMVAAVNAMRTTLEAAYGELSAANAEMRDDIVARRRAEARLRDLVERLTASNSDLERFAYVASHDLQEPLRIMRLYAQLLDRKYRGRIDGDADSYVGFIADSALRMYELINDLLVYSRIGSGGEAFASVPLERPCAAALDRLRDDIAGSGARVAIDPLPIVEADEVQMMMVFQHLIGNALKFRRPGVPPELRVSATPSDEGWVVSVADNGIGIEPSDQDVFEIFRRQHSWKDYAGTGVGLAICKRVVQRHKGRIWLAARPGPGTTICFSLAARGGS